MRTKRSWMIGLTIVALLVVGGIALAGNGFGGNRAVRAGQGADAAATCACAGAGDCVAALDGTGNGGGAGYGMGFSTARPLDGTGYGAQRGCGLMARGCGGR